MATTRMRAAALLGGLMLLAGNGPRGIEDEVLAQINTARTHPRDYAETLRRYRQSFDGRVAHDEGDDVGMLTVEGPAAVDEAIAFLERQAPLPPLTHGQVLALAAARFADEQGPRGGIGHLSAAGLTPGQRVRAAGGDLYVSEAVSYGYGDAAGVVRQLIVDDGERSRGHRRILFTPTLRFAGAGCGRHAQYRYMCVVDLAESIDGRPALPHMAHADTRQPAPTADDLRP